MTFQNKAGGETGDGTQDTDTPNTTHLQSFTHNFCLLRRLLTPLWSSCKHHTTYSLEQQHKHKCEDQRVTLSWRNNLWGYTVSLVKVSLAATYEKCHKDSFTVPLPHSVTSSSRAQDVQQLPLALLSSGNELELLARWSWMTGDRWQKKKKVRLILYIPGFLHSFETLLPVTAVLALYLFFGKVFSCHNLVFTAFYILRTDTSRYA